MGLGKKISTSGISFPSSWPLVFPNFLKFINLHIINNISKLLNGFLLLLIFSKKKKVIVKNLLIYEKAITIHAFERYLNFYLFNILIRLIISIYDTLMLKELIYFMKNIKYQKNN